MSGIDEVRQIDGRIAGHGQICISVDKKIRMWRNRLSDTRISAIQGGGFVADIDTTLGRFTGTGGRSADFGNEVSTAWVTERS